MKRLRTMAMRWLPPQAWLAMVLAMVLLSGCDRGTSLPRLAPLDAGARILAFGDSLTYGTGATPETSYPAVLSALTGRNVINAGIPGETTAEGLERLPALLDRTDPALVILCLGGNDMLRGQDRAAMKRNLAGMIGLIRARGVPVLLLGVPEPRLMGLETEATYRELAAEFGLPLEADTIPDVLGDGTRRSDRIHPNAAGYADMAHAIAALLKKAGAV